MAGTLERSVIDELDEHHSGRFLSCLSLITVSSAIYLSLSVCHISTVAWFGLGPQLVSKLLKPVASRTPSVGSPLSAI